MCAVYKSDAMELKKRHVNETTILDEDHYKSVDVTEKSCGEQTSMK